MVQYISSTVSQGISLLVADSLTTCQQVFQLINGFCWVVIKPGRERMEWTQSGPCQFLITLLSLVMVIVSFLYNLP